MFRLALLFGIIAYAVLLASGACVAQGAVNSPCDNRLTSLPSTEPQDTVQALSEPDRYAWRLFVALNWPGDIATRSADPSKKLGDEGPTTWETWRNARGTASDGVFKPGGIDPGEWLPTAQAVADVGAGDRLEIGLPAKLTAALAQTMGPMTKLAADRPVGTGNEVRMNKSTFEYIRSNNLYSKSGIINTFNSGVRELKFPSCAKEIKAEWRIIKEADKSRYHWTEFTQTDGTKEIWGLTALHITTKDLPRWFWATFEHVDNQKAAPLGAPEPANVGWKVDSVDRFACGNAPPNCNKAPTGIGLQGTKWENYRLRGTQIDWVDATGNSTILGNSQIEGVFAPKSSCMTCHAKATRDGNFSGLANADFQVGIPNRDDFIDQVTHKPLYLQFDFLWDLERAQ
jgi:hypothetical protein